MRINRITVALAAALAVTAGTPGVAAAREPKLKITTTASPTPAAPGATVQYTITVENTGTVDFSLDPNSPHAWFADDLEGVLDDADYNDDVTASAGKATFTQRTGRPLILWSGPLARGARATVTYSVTVPTTSKGGDGSLDSEVTNTTKMTNCGVDAPNPIDLGPPTRLATGLAAPCDTTVPIS